MRRTALLLTLAMAPVMGGCMTVAKEAFYTATGAGGRLTEIQTVGSLADYDSFKIEPFTTKLGKAAPASLRGKIVPGVSKRLVESTVLATSGKKTLTIRGEIVYVDQQGLASGALSPMEQLVCYVTLHDPAGKKLGWSVVAGVNKSRTRAGTAGEAELADGLGKGITLWLTRRGVKKREKEEGQQ
jgi:hypothetical protein